MVWSARGLTTVILQEALVLSIAEQRGIRQFAVHLSSMHFTGQNQILIIK
jgi:hypothetical protein